MVSLICHEELDAGESSLTRPVYIRPIMKPDENDISNPRSEKIPPDIFFEDILERSVRRIFEGDESADAIPSIKIINLSICDPGKLFYSQLSSIGKLLDWLSEKYQVLFCVSAGNNKNDIELEYTGDELKSMSEADIITTTVKYILSDIRNRRILAPADSINALCIGAIHSDHSPVPPTNYLIDILPTHLLPSPISGHGSGFRNSIKPEIYIPGGKQLFSNLHPQKKFSVSKSHSAPGQKVATTPVYPGETTRTVYTRGTSNATAIASRSAARIFEVLEELQQEEGERIPADNIAVLLKTLLIDSASWGKGSEFLYDNLTDINRTIQKK